MATLPGPIRAPAPRPHPRPHLVGRGLLLSAVAHGALMGWLLWGGAMASEPPDPPVTAVTAVSGIDYARAVSASMTPVAATPVAASERLEAVGGTLQRGEAAESLVAGAAEPVPPTAARPVETVTAAATPVAPPPVPEPVEPPPAPARPVEPLRPIAAEPVAAEPVAAEPPPPAESAAPSGTVEALPEPPRAAEVEAAPRPPERPRDLLEPDPEPEPEPEPRQAPDPAPPVAEAAPPSTAGNAAASARQGSRQGQEGATAARQGQAASGASSAAAASYPGEVMQHLGRTRRDRLRSSGTAVIAFTLSASGGLAGLAVAQSSGVPEVDQAGLALVQRAAPFPAPPRGAQTSFSFQFTGD
ncbi:energy transducer TonB family protein [Rubellimicrobium aerolatum]|uniref:Energy transducer TonB n=1 Tax=Rubellimicrobium aerolatum TaxID=490979 RepID=A0ABW0SH14_9RHOB|nr:energy transducer TonB [Rubellimicrobium aerolatum]MBP1807530.1 protein TonB [Rubellimicrobium aerolatum]